MKKELMSHDKLINLFTLFSIGSLALFLNLIIALPNTQLGQNIRFGLLLITGLTYETVIFSVITYQIVSRTEKFLKHFQKNREGYFILLVLILAGTVLVAVWIRNPDPINVLQNAVLIGLALIGIPQVNKRVMKIWNNIGKKKEKK